MSDFPAISDYEITYSLAEREEEIIANDIARFFAETRLMVRR